MKLFFFSRFSQ